MRLSDLNKNLRSKKVERERIFEVKKRYLTLYRFYLMQLWDSGYLGNPLNFNIVEIRKTLKDIKGAIDKKGYLNISEESLRYLMIVNKNNEIELEFLKNLYNVIYFKNQVDALDRYYDSLNFDKVSKNLKLSLKEKGPFLIVRGGFQACESVIEIFTGAGNIIEKEELVEPIYAFLLENVLGIKGEHLGGYFMKGWSAEEECYCLKYLMSGCVSLTGSECERISKYIKKGKEYDSYGYLVRDALSSLDVKDDCFVMNSDCCFRINNQDRDTLMFSSIAILDDNYDGVVMDVKNNFYGLNAVVYSLEHIERENIKYTGSPFYMFNNGEKIVVIDEEQVTDLKLYWWDLVKPELRFDGLAVESINFEDDCENFVFKEFLTYESGGIKKIETNYSKERLDRAREVVSGVF